MPPIKSWNLFDERFKSSKELGGGGFERSERFRRREKKEEISE